MNNTEIHDGTLNVITAIKLSDTDNVVVVGTDVNLIILLSKRSYHSNAYSCVNLELDIVSVIFKACLAINTALAR